MKTRRIRPKRVLAAVDSTEDTADLGPIGQPPRPTLDDMPEWFTTIEQRGYCNAVMSNGCEVGPYRHPMNLCMALEACWPHYASVHVEELYEGDRRVSVVTKYKRTDLVTDDERAHVADQWEQVRRRGYARRYKRPFAERFAAPAKKGA